MKAKNLYLLISREASTDSSDNMNSIIKIIDRFSFSAETNEKVDQNDSKLVVPINYTIVSSWYLTELIEKGTKFKFKFQVVQPSGETADMAEQEINVNHQSKRLGINVNASGLPVSVSGEYILRAHLLNDNDNEIGQADYPFDVEIKWQKQETESEA